MISNILYFHPYLGKIPILTNIVQRGCFNHQLEISVLAVSLDTSRSQGFSGLQNCHGCAWEPENFNRWSLVGLFLLKSMYDMYGYICGVSSIWCWICFSIFWQLKTFIQSFKGFLMLFSKCWQVIIFIQLKYSTSFIELMLCSSRFFKHWHLCWAQKACLLNVPTKSSWVSDPKMFFSSDCS